jgi:hypothetical protein
MEVAAMDLRIPVVSILLAGIAAASAGAQDIDGTWKLTYLNLFDGTVERSECLVKLKKEAGKITGEVVDDAASRRMKEVRQEGDFLRIELTSGQPIVFETMVPKGPTKRMLGGLKIGKYVHPAWLSVTSDTKFDRSESTHVCPPMQEAAALNELPWKLRAQASPKRTKDPEARKALLKKADEAELAAKKETAKLYRQVIAKYPDDPVVFGAVLGLMRSAQVNGVKLEEAKEWGKIADKMGTAYGPSFQTGFSTQAAEALIDQEGLASMAVEYARRVEKTLRPKTPPQEQIEVLDLLARALRKADQNNEAKSVAARIAKLEDALDRAYLATLPAVEAFPGRKTKSDRAVMIEQFINTKNASHNMTERACSMLLKTYKPSELILVQYHLSSTSQFASGPVLTSGPLTNPDSQARYAYFNKAFPVEMRSPSGSLFNGHPKFKIAAPDVARKYKAFREVIEPLLEEKAVVALTAKAVRSDDKIDIQINVSSLPNPGPDKKLRIVLAEETIRYPGQRYLGDDAVRLHHNVVRACPGGVAGKSLGEANSKHKLTINIGELRSQLAKYLEVAMLNDRTLKDPAPLLVLEHLRVIAFVQDDSTREILQAVQVEVK